MNRINSLKLSRIFLRVLVALSIGLIPSVTFAAQGDLYVIEASNGRVLKFTPAGAKSVFASGLDNPRGLAFDHSGNLFVSEIFIGNNTSEGRIYKFTPDGARSLFAGGLGQPMGLAFDRSGDLFVADIRAIYEFTPAGAKSTFASGNLSPSDLAFDFMGNLFVADSGYNRIRKFTPEGKQTIFASDSGSYFYGLAFDHVDNLFVSDFASIAKFTPAGKRSTFVDGLNNAFGLAFDVNENLFEADDNTGKIFKFTPDGTKTTFASGLNGPWLIAFEPVVEKLRNISARGFVQTGDDILIGGFNLGGNALQNNAVVVRAIGPSLSNAGVANPLADPTLELHDASGSVIAANDNWQETQKTQITATGLAPDNPKEAAIYATLPQGSYTAVVRGVGGTTGTAVVEIYSVTH